MPLEQCHILIADDQPENILVLDDILGRFYTVHSVSNGRAALEHINSGNIVDLILLDVVMPDIDGFEVCRYLKENASTRDIPVIFLTGLESDADEAQGLSLGAEDFIHKPVSPPVVLARVKNHLKLSRATRILRERSEDMERLATEAARLGVWNYDIGGSHLTWNDEMFRLHDIPQGEFSFNFSDMLRHVHPDDIERMMCKYQQALDGQGDIASEFRVVRRDGDIRVFKVNATVRRNAMGKPTRLLGGHWDVTDYRRALEELEQAKTRAEAASVAKSNFLAIMSHELRTPLNAISGFGQLLRDVVHKPEWKEHLDTICQASDNLLRIIQDILDVSSIEAGRPMVEPRPFVLLDELALMTKYFQLEVQRKNLGFSVTIGQGVPSHLIGDARLLRQTLINLIGNAVKFTSEGGVEIAVELLDVVRQNNQKNDQSQENILSTSLKSTDTFSDCDDSMLLAFHITDTGPGVKEENQSRIFEIFEQEDNTSTRHYGGVGLGLAIANRLAHLLGGRIELHSTAGKGARFSLIVEMARWTVRNGVITARHSLSPAIIASSSDVSSEARVLVVEDDRFCLRLVVELLAETGWRVSIAEDGKTALHLLKEQRFDLVLLDIQLPEIDGLEVTRQIRSGKIDDCDPNIPIVAITAHAMPNDSVCFLQHGVTAYLNKPFNVKEFISVVRTAFDAKNTPRRFL
ncbi:putative Histidine kinase [Azospirillaceae bacterium]